MNTAGFAFKIALGISCTGVIHDVCVKLRRNAAKQKKMGFFCLGKKLGMKRFIGCFLRPSETPDFPQAYQW